MINAVQLRHYVIIPALASIAMDGDSAEMILLTTCAQESKGGTYLHQDPKGPALSIYQIEPKTYQDTIHYILQRQTLRQHIIESCNFATFPPSNTEIISNLKYATIIARVHYYQFAASLPAANDIEGMWHYYKQYWNTEGGKATRDEFMANCKAFLHI
jgi:hypothetical protein